MQATRAFVQNIAEFRGTLSEHHRPTWANITTITMVGKADRPLNPEVTRKVFRKMRFLPVSSTNGTTKNWRMFYSDFYNQVSIGYEDALSTKKVKIFPNGALQVAGCADLIDAANFTKQLCLLLRLIYGVTMSPQDFRIVMINANFSLNHSVDLYRATEIFKGSFDPDRYSAVKIKSNGTTTSIFASGAVIITGANCIERIFDAYKYIVDTCIAHGLYIAENNKSEKFQKVLGFTVE